MSNFKVSIRQDRCKGCGLCQSVCPKKVLKQSDKKPNQAGYFPMQVIKQDDCIGCKRCALMCPDSVITIEKKDAK